MENISNEYVRYEFYADMKNANRMFESYGDITAPMVVRNTEDGWAKQPNVNGWFHKTEFQKFLNNKYALLAHGKVKDMTQEIIETELSGEGISLLKTEEAHGGHTKYWKYMSDEVFSIDKEDDIHVGFAVRNGIGTGVSLGVDVFTFRLLCKNGAIAKGRNLATVSIRHQGDINRIMKMFTDSVKQVMVSAKDIIRYYRKATQIKVGNAEANLMYQRIADLGEIYLPSNWNIKTPDQLAELKKEGKFKNNMDLVSVRGTSTLWDSFNEVTANQRLRLERRRIGFPAVADRAKQAAPGHVCRYQCQGGHLIP